MYPILFYWFFFRFFEIPMKILPNIRSSSEIYGLMKAGSLEGVPISGCLGDQSAALVGQLCFQDGQAKNTYGTGCFLLCNTRARKAISFTYSENKSLLKLLKVVFLKFWTLNYSCIWKWDRSVGKKMFLFSFEVKTYCSPKSAAWVTLSSPESHPPTHIIGGLTLSLCFPCVSIKTSLIYSWVFFFFHLQCEDNKVDFIYLCP